MNLPKKHNLQKNIRRVNKTRLSLRPLNANIRMLMAGSIVLGSLTLASHSHAALPMPKPAGAWATARSPLPRVSSASGWSQVNADLWRSGTTDAQFSDKTLTVKQTEGRVILSWDSFDIDVSHLVEFKQPDSSSIALNRVINSASPSKILGTLKANGQIYLINNNGFLFGANSVVDVNSLVVSTLDISDDVFNRGISKVFDDDASAAFSGNGDVYLRDPNSGDYILDTDGNRFKIGIYVEEGAQINTDNYGRVIVVAPEIINKGTITSPDGQVLMAAATDRVYLQESSDESVRGLLVEVKTGGEVINGGHIITPRGNTTLMGFAVNQQGLISASTSVRVNGSIRLLARENAPISPRILNRKKVLEATTTVRATDQGDGLGTIAKVSLGEGSVTAVMPEIEDKSTAVAEQEQPVSSVEIMGQTVHFESDSAVIAPSGTVDVIATETPNAPDKLDIANSSEIIMDSGSLVDVAGLTSAEKSMESNVIEVETRSNEFADAPVQKNGFLHGKTLRIDIREGTPLANIQPALDAIKSTIEERSAEGGTINFSSQGAVTLNQGSQVNISGGAINYRKGYIKTTQLVGVDGKIYDISQASPDLEYVGILGEVSKDYKKWGVTKTWQVAGPFSRGRFESAYTSGQAAGTFNIDTHQLVQDGDIIANTINGRRQRLADHRASGGSLNVNLDYLGGNYQTLVFQNNKDLNAPNLDGLKSGGDETSIPAPLIIEADYFRRNGLQKVSYKTGGKIVLRDNLDMQLSDGGNFSLTTSGTEGIDVGGRVVGHGTDISMTASRGDVVLGENALIDSSGRWVNDSPVVKPTPDFEGVFIDAGKVDITSKLASVIMNEGSRIRSNSGAWLTSEGELKAGVGGDVFLAASTDVNGNGSLFLDGRIEGFSFADSGTLSLSANEFRFASTVPDNNGRDPSAPVYIAEDFVQQSGFGAYEFNSSRNGITFESGVLLQPSRENLVLNSRDVFSTASASDVSSVSTRQRLADEIRQPVDLGFSHQSPVVQTQDKAIVMEQGSRILTEAGAEVSFSSSSSIFMNGSVEAPAGRINLTVTDPASVSDPGYIPEQGIWLGADSVLSTASAFIPTHSEIPGLRQGRLIDGGEVTLTANRGFIVMDEGALIDVSGTDAVLDLPDPAYRGPGVRLQETRVASDAGEVNLAAAEGIISGATIRGRANTELGAEGGRLKVGFVSRRTNVDLLQSNSSATPFIETPRKIIVSKEKPQSAAEIPEQGEAIADEANGYAWLDGGLLNDSGFDSIELKGSSNIVFKGDSGIIARREVILDSPVISWQGDSVGDTGLAAILSSYVALGSTSTLNANDGVGGGGRLLVEANMIDLVGAASLQGFDQVRLNSNTDIRLRGNRENQSETLSTLGEWNSRGRLELNADKVYPASLSDYTISADEVVIAKHGGMAEEMQTVFGNDANAIIANISQAHKATPVLSAGGRLAIEADSISQAGELRAPFGEISLKAESLLNLQAGSLTSTSAEGQIIPLGRTAQTGLDWQYDFVEGDTLRVTRPPEKRILLSSDDVRFDKGAVIDMSGGGDLQAWEFVSGPGGTRDIFASDSGSFAVLPAFTDYAPYDEAETRAAGFRVGDLVYLSGVGDLPAGEYALLPARYALLDGAYLVTPRDGFTDITPGINSYLTDKTPVVAGQYRVAGTGIQDQNWNGFAIESSAQARRRAEILLTSANRFYTDRALADETLVPFLPQDAGQLGVSAFSRLDLAGELRSGSEGNGRGGRLDIEATNLAIVSQRSASGVNSDRVELLAEELNQLDMESLLLGGIRKQTDEGTQITVATQSLVIETNSNDKDDRLNLSGTEILLAAQDRIDLKRGVSVRAEGKGGLGADTLIVKGDGALVRISAGEQVSVSRNGSRGVQGTINIDEGARLAASRAMLLDASYETTINGKLEINNGSLNIGAERINLGNAPVSATGLLLNRELLDSLYLSELVMTSRKGTHVYGDVDFNFDSVVFDGAGIVSHGDGSNRFTVQADTMRFTNSAAGMELASTSGDAFSVNARQIEVGKGDYTLAGFDSVDMTASEQIIGSGESNFTIKADVRLNTPLISSANGADTTIDAAGYQFALEKMATDVPPAAAGIGARLSINAETISDRGAILLPSGTLELNATQGLLIDNALIDVSGVSRSFRSEIKTASAGKVILNSEQADVELTQSSRIDLSAADEGGDAGMLEVNTPEGEFIWQGTVSATAAKGEGGRFDLNAQSMSDVFSVLNDKLAGAGFDESVSLRLGQGDIALAETDTLHAHKVTLTADTGNVSIDGVIDARGDNGGRVNLSAGDNVEMSGRIDASATAEDGNGGAVQLATIDNDNDGAGEINVTGEIDVSAGARGKGGEVGYRANRIDSNNDGQDDEIAIINTGTVTGAAAVNYEAVRVYEDINVITQTRMNQWQRDTRNYMSFAADIENRLNGSGNNGRLLSGLEVRSNGDMRINTDMDFSGWRYGDEGEPGVLTLSAERDLLINQDLNDGFENAAIDVSPRYGSFVPVTDLLMTDESWSYRMVAGSNRQSANAMDTNIGIGNITLARNTKVRTGTGSIDIASGNDITLSNDASVIYTAGRASETNRWGGLSNETVAFVFYSEYPVDGGDIRISTGGDMNGAVSNQSVRDWLMSTGSWTRNENHRGEMPTAWGVALTQTMFTGNPATSAYRRGIGALGGGDINIAVKGNMQDVSVMMPTSGKPVGESLSADPTVPDFSENRVETSGGGALNVTTGGDIRGGMFYLGRGDGTLLSDGGLLAGDNGIHPVFAMGDTQFNITSKNDLGIGAVFDPLIEQATFNSAGNGYFFTYSDTSALALTSVAGDIRFYNDGNKNQVIYPASLSAASLAGDIVIDKGFTLFPSATSQLELLAANSIMTADAEVTVFMPDADPALIPNVKYPVTISNERYERLDRFGEADEIHAKTPLHRGDEKPVRVIAENGSISSPGTLVVNVAKKLEAYAGKDIRNSTFIIQNVDNEDRSSIIAGRDFRYDIPRLFDGGVQSKEQRVQVSGPGQLILQAGGNIELGTSAGIESIGNTRNTVLADRGADIVVIAGVKDNMDYAGFAETYVKQSDKYLAALKTFVDSGVVDFDQETTGLYSSAELNASREKFAGLDEQKQQAFLRELFLREIRNVGVRSAESGSGFYQPAYDAIATLFPGSYAGDINLFFSKIHTIDGGNIQLLTPGGGVNAGLASSKGLAKEPSDLGIVAQREGRIDAFTRDDFAVNLSRVFTLAGGDIMLFSHEGNIDAGRGAKSALAAPPPSISYDEKGNLIVEFPNAIQGSGIRTVASGDGEAGDVYLFAPQGAIIAGDAGIDSGGDGFIDAPIIPTDNIKIGGTSIGVPTASASLAAGLTGVSNLSASSNKVAEESTSSIGKTSEEAGFANTPMGFLNVELVGFGGGVTTTAPGSRAESKKNISDIP